MRLNGSCALKISLALCAIGLTACPPPQQRWLTGDEGKSRVLVPSAEEIRASRERLETLRREREAAGLGHDYRVGPGDLIKVSVFDVEGLDRTVRVADTGTMTLPLIGTLRVAGLTERGLEETVASELEAKYLQNAQVSVFVQEYNSQRVAVLGAVMKPGQYSLSRDRTTILDMISEAGGLARDAGSRIYLLPGERTDPTKLALLNTAAKVGLSNTDSIADAFGPNSDPIIFDVSDILSPGTQTALTLPARAGDVVVVPEAGQFLVDGWVEKPGAYSLARGATVLAAITAAGGPLYPAATSGVQVVRTERSGVRTVLNADISTIIDGKKQDIALQAGDIVYVPASAAKLPLYAVYQFVSNVFRIAGTVPVL
jgi:polysaccharide biosynthesis/export protein